MISTKSNQSLNEKIMAYLYHSQLKLMQCWTFLCNSQVSVCMVLRNKRIWIKVEGGRRGEFYLNRNYVKKCFHFVYHHHHQGVLHFWYWLTVFDNIIKVKWINNSPFSDRNFDHCQLFYTKLWHEYLSSDKFCWFW